MMTPSMSSRAASVPFRAAQAAPEGAAGASADGRGVGAEPSGLSAAGAFRTRKEEDSASDDPPEHRPPVRILLVAFMVMYLGSGCLIGNPQRALSLELQELKGDVWTEGEAREFQDATGSLSIVKMVMRVGQILFLVFLPLRGLVHLGYIAMLASLLTPLAAVWGLGMNGNLIIFLQYSLGGIGLSCFSAAFLTVISPLGKDTKTFAIMGGPLAIGMNGVILNLANQWGMPAYMYFVFAALCIPAGMLIFHIYSPRSTVAVDRRVSGWHMVVHSVQHPRNWLLRLAPWLLAKAAGDFVNSNAFPLLFYTFNTDRVPFWGGPDGHATIPFNSYTALYWFPLMALGEALGRRVPNWVSIGTRRRITLCLFFGILACIGGEALDFFLIPVVTGIGIFVAMFGNGFIYGLSAKFIDQYIPEEHRYASYSLWSLAGDLGSFAGQSEIVVALSQFACWGRDYEFVCHASGLW